MLKLLNGLIKPDRGKISIRGRVNGLIELGAGFNPILSGLENIYVNAAVLGIPRSNVKKLVDQIVEFSGIGDFIDAPVQSYSSGMKVRLGFAIAAQLEPDIMLIDEVLAVGDAEFRSRCMDLIWELADSGKVAFIFISHNMLAVDGLCHRVMLFEKGVAHQGDKHEMIARYYGDNVHRRYEKLDAKTRQQLMVQSQMFGSPASGEIEIVSVKLTDEQGVEKEYYHPWDHLCIHLEFISHRQLEKVISSVSLVDASGLVISIERSIYHEAPPFPLNGKGNLEIEFAPLQLKTGMYTLGLAFQDPTLQSVYCLRSCDNFRVVEAMPNPGGKEGFFSPRVAWSYAGKKYERLART
jgi:lipopolysaccharide transport system ATP-binding protein